MNQPAIVTAATRRGRSLVLLLAGGLVIGTLDLAFAILFWLPRGVRPIQILQSIASGWLGEDSFEGGIPSAVLGAVSHYFIATMFVVVYLLASRRLPRLLQRPVTHGLAYGVVLYLVMNFVVLPLSAAGMPSFKNSVWVVSSIAAHLVFGVLCALFAAKAGSAPWKAKPGTDAS